MPLYENSRIYKIESLIGNCVYYGSTTLALCQRMVGHRSNYKKDGVISSKHVLKYPDACIYLVEEYPCDNKEQLKQREGYYIKHNDCVNRYIAGRTRKEWASDNKHHLKTYYNENQNNILEYKQKYYQTNKTIIDAKSKIRRNKHKSFYDRKVLCECGAIVTKYGINRHKKTTAHNNYLHNPFIDWKL